MLSFLMVLLGASQPRRRRVVSLDVAGKELTYRGDAGPNDIDVFVFARDDGTFDIDVRDFDGNSTTDSPLCGVTVTDDIECNGLSFAPTGSLYGGAGDDTLETSGFTGGPGGHLVDGQGENDKVHGGPLPETLMGGPGTTSSPRTAARPPRACP